MTVKLKPFDASEYLDTDEGIAAFLADAFETEDPKYIVHALGIVARAIGMTEIARKSGISRKQLYKSFGKGGKPTIRTLFPVLTALGVKLTPSVVKHQ